MFATLLGPLPPPPAAGTADPAAALVEILAAQEAVNLEPVTDGRAAAALEDGADPVARWRATAGLTTRPVKASLRGPWSSASAATRPPSGRNRDRAVLAAAERIREIVLALSVAGCPLVEIEETEAHRIGGDDVGQRVFREAHGRLVRDVPGTHLSLSIVGGSAWEAGAATILDPPYHSLAVDLIAGPDNWRLVAQAPTERGIVAGALDVRPEATGGPEVLIWAAHYAASLNGRGIARVGLGSGGGLGHLTWERAVARLHVLGEAVRIEGLPEDERADAIDPRAVSSRAGALGHTRQAERRAARRREG
jgi:methionine synthase II (cobalamin-independent)